MPTDDDDRYLAPLEGPIDPNAPHVTVDCRSPGCRISFFVSKHHPALPDGPFLCHDHSDMRLSFKKADQVQVAILCDRCEAQLVADGNTREDANEKLRALVIEKRWQVTNRVAGMLDVGETFGDPTPMRGTQDLCADCRTKF